MFELGIAAKLPTRRGCRGSVQKQRIIQPMIWHRPPNRQAIPSKQTGVDSANLAQLIAPVEALDNCSTATLGLLNVRASLISAIVPHRYKCQHLTRNDRRGGGVRVLFKASFHLALSKPWPVESFECIEAMLRGSSVAAAVRIFVVYRPPSSWRKSKPFRAFLEEFGKLLDRVSIKKTGLTICGDFNVYYGNDDDKDARDLAAILNDSNLQQHVTSPTHCRGNILDLVISPVTGSVLTDVSVESLLTDHHAIICASSFQLNLDQCEKRYSVFADDNDCRAVDPLYDFELATCNDICDLVMKGTSKVSSDIDIISATLLKSNIATLAPGDRKPDSLPHDHCAPRHAPHYIILPTPLLSNVYNLF